MHQVYYKAATPKCAISYRCSLHWMRIICHQSSSLLLYLAFKVKTTDLIAVFLQSGDQESKTVSSGNVLFSVECSFTQRLNAADVCRHQLLKRLPVGEIVPEHCTSTTPKYIGYSYCVNQWRNFE